MSMSRGAIAVVLGVFLMTGATPSAALPQDPPDDLAELLPSEVLAFGEIANPGQILKDWKEYVSAFCTKEGKANVCDTIEKAVAGGLRQAPEKLMKDLEKGLPTVQRVGFALMPPGEEEFFPRWAAVATSSDPKFFQTLLEEDLRVFAAEERQIRGFTVLSIRKLGEMRLEPPMLAAAAGHRLVVTSQPATMRGILDRAAGKGAGDDLRRNAVYRALSPLPAGEPALRGFSGSTRSGMLGGMIPGRMGAHEMDKSDAAFDMSKFYGFSVEATLRPGKVSTKSRLHYDPSHRFANDWKLQPGPKEALALVPSDALVVMHLNLPGGAEVWKKIKDVFNRYDEVEKRGPESPMRQFDRIDLDRTEKDLKKQFGFGLEDMAQALGGEAALAFVGDDAFDSGENFERSFLFVARVSDAARTRVMIEKFTKKTGGYEVSKEEETEFFLPGEAERHGSPAFALTKETCLIAGKADGLRAALKAAKEGQSVLKKLPAGVDSAAAVVAARHRAVWNMIRMIGAEIPDLAGDLDLDQWSVLLGGTPDNPMGMSSEDAGLAACAQTLVLNAATLPFLMIRGFAEPAGLVGPLGVMAPPAQLPEQEQPAAPALPPEELAARVKAFVEDLRAEEILAREEATQGLTALGPQAAPMVAEALKNETDPEAKERLMSVLIGWKAFDVVPEVLARKVDGFISELSTAVSGEGEMSRWGMGGFARWGRDDRLPGEGFPWNLEPWVQPLMLKGLPSSDILGSAAGLKAVAEKLGGETPSVQVQRNLAGMLAYLDCSKIQDAVLAAHQRVKDPETRAYLQIAIGWCENPKATELLVGGFKHSDRWMSRASFLAADRTKDPAVIGKLIELLKDEDPETRWNASYTLKRITSEKVRVNVYWDEKELEAGRAAAAKWWEENRGTFKIESGSRARGIPVGTNAGPRPPGEMVPIPPEVLPPEEPK